MKRYDLEYIAYGSEGQNEMREAVDGDWVKADEAIKRIAELEAENQKLRALVKRGADCLRLNMSGATVFQSDCMEALK